MSASRVSHWSKGYQDLLETLVPGRACGACTVCCEVLEIDQPELKKPVDVLCPHCTGTGCGIYESRPAVCKSWHCLWRRIGAMPDEVRPDRCGVVFSINRIDSPRTPLERIYVSARALNSLEDFNTPIARTGIAMFVAEGTLPVWVSFKGIKTLVHPRAEIADLVNSGAPPPPHLADEVKDWLMKFPPVA